MEGKSLASIYLASSYNHINWEYTIAGLDWWTGPVDWTGGLTFELILGVLRNSLIIHIMELRISLISAASTTAKDYNNALHGPLQLCKLQGDWLEKS